ncbi:D-2-hydroxyacid dehydrogenase [Shewanella aestuarii]|uniref:D-2-hydroxyacid dehydrogenase n=1 Tax=Shewanella aestuarii TaxID=1028752 RepID=A0A6G9QGT0_9GAMM|nr:D-2-hydroxyacid dehydrogenase [Shewanella aestuarii]QIR13754.1 D-2-hydroxyacid dehydrogenase [Shewanella aestuarii]
MKIVVLDGFTLNPGDLSWQGLVDLAECQIYDHTLAKEVLARCNGAAMVLTNKTQLPATLLSQLPDLKYIGVLATGTNVVDVNFAKQQGIVVSNVPAYGPDAVAQMVFAHILHFYQHVALHDGAVKQGQWGASRDFCFTLAPLTSLKGKTLGLVGFGDIAKQTCQIGLAFGMKVLIHTPTPKTNLPERVTWCSLEHLLPQVDILSLHCPLTPQTHHLINKQTLALLASNTLLVNSARGDLVNEQDLADWLNQGRGYAGLDVLSSEPPKNDNPLLQANNVVITPHIAWATKEARQNLMDIAVNNCRQFIQGTPINCV